MAGAVKNDRQQMNIMQLIDDFGSEDHCRAYLEHLRWPEGVRCINCGSDSISRITTRNQLDCNACRTRFSVTSGTVFHDSHLPLRKWFLAVYMIGEAKKGVSANQLKRTLNVAYKTAWYLCHRIRWAMGLGDETPLSGTVEVDETYIGGKRRHVGQAYTENKAMVMGALERNGNVRLRFVKGEHKLGGVTARRFIAENIADEAGAIYTDGHGSYRGIGDADTRHEWVDHSAEEWVRGDVSTNGVEAAWSLLKRSIVGSFHQLSEKHLPAYLDEFEFRFNNRENPYLFRDTLRAMIRGERLTYAAVTEA